MLLKISNRLNWCGQKSTTQIVQQLSKNRMNSKLVGINIRNWSKNMMFQLKGIQNQSTLLKMPSLSFKFSWTLHLALENSRTMKTSIHTIWEASLPMRAYQKLQQYNWNINNSPTINWSARLTIISRTLTSPIACYSIRNSSTPWTWPMPGQRQRVKWMKPYSNSVLK